MLRYFHNLSWPLAMLIVLLISILFAGALLLLSRKWRNDNLFKPHLPLLEMMIAFVTLIFGIQVSFIIVLQQTWINEGVNATHEEVAALKAMLRDASEFGPEGYDHIHASIKNYITYVVQTEWREIESGNDSFLAAEEYLSPIWQAYKNLPINSEKEKIWYQNTLTDLDRFLQARTKRIMSINSSLHPMLWAWILLLGVTALFLASLVPVRTLSIDFLLLALFSSIIGMVLYLTFSLNYPFEGQVKVDPIEFEELLQKITQQ